MGTEQGAISLGVEADAQLQGQALFGLHRLQLEQAKGELAGGDLGGHPQQLGLHHPALVLAFAFELDHRHHHLLQGGAAMHEA